MTAPRAGTHGARLLAVLADGKWHSTSALHRRAGNMIVHSRISELRTKGYRIEHKHVPGKIGAVAHKYQWLDAPGVETHDEPEPMFEYEELSPRRPAERFRIYRRRTDQLVCVATCPNEAHVLGVIKDQRDPEGGATLEDDDSVGILDAHGYRDHNPLDEHGNYTLPGSWVIKPWQADWR